MGKLGDEFVNSVNLNEGSAFPYLVLNVADDSVSPLNLGFRVMHWHDDLQFIYVHAGELFIKTLDADLTLRCGEGAFINKRVVHYVGRRSSCRYSSILFPEHFLEFYAGSPAKSLVSRITESEEVKLLRFSSDGGWNTEVLDVLRGLCSLESQRTELYVYGVLVRLCSLWLILCKNLELPSRHMETATEVRMRKMLRYLNEHYAGRIALEDVAASANVSKSECARCFRESLGTTPFGYLIELRLSEAARLLEDTDMPIAEVASRVGFHQSSYFGKVFREKVGCSPREYRKACRAGLTGKDGAARA